MSVVGVDEALPRHAVGHHRHDLLRHRELPEEEHDEAGQHGIEDHALDGVGDHERERAAEADERNREREEQDHQRHVGGELQPEDMVCGGQVEHLDEETRGDGGHDHVGDHLRERPQPGRDDPEAPAVAHLEELSDAHRARLAEAVDHESGEPEHDGERHQDVAPEADRETRPVVDFDVGHEPDDRERVRHVAHRDHVAPAQAPGREKVGHPAHVSARAESHPHHEADGKNENEPVVPDHGSVLSPQKCARRIRPMTCLPSSPEWTRSRL